MSENFRRFVKVRGSDLPPAALIRFRCAKLHRVQVSGSDTSTGEYNTIYDVLKSRGWKETDADTEWHIFWADKDWIHGALDQIHLDPNQHVNHFRNHYELTRKDLLVKNMKRMRRQCEKEGRQDLAKEYEVYPLTFAMPQEYNMFVEEFKRHQGATWIMKPVGRSQGAGIFLVTKLAQLQQWRPSINWAPANRKNSDGGGKDPDDDDLNREGPESYVIQKYVDAPLVIGGKKFDIRLYVAVISYQPLTVYMHRAGFCRFSMSRYSMDKGDMSNLGQHLTNVAVQKHSGKAAYKRTGAKWALNFFKQYLLSNVGVDTVNKLFSDIESIVIHSLLSVQRVMIHDKHCFELYGYDILIDSWYRPWLLEVNASPSLTANTKDDYDMKFGLLDDVMTLIDMEKYLTNIECQVGGFDLLYHAGVRYGPPEGSVFTSFLGCNNNRLVQLKRLAKARAWEMSKSENATVPPVNGKRTDAGADDGKGTTNIANSGNGRSQRSARPYPVDDLPSAANKR
eukprot:gnl/TRDRNA2_/TRDRNA2_93740_c0_seq1.p1 gnl/TRDRNA2_/TRDRNA2_93740_c0~~gnl/TRDRNA2_/TRDRNA2_93740_c0_seq1.p1  ORF type:complete len:509 (+),score=87.00 gnl/TRDRNA2_/TRDRNA2_93740_c0_seq1:206-1732(+)